MKVGWVPPPDAAETLFYDGTCGFCHRSVRFVLAHDAAGAFRFAPLQGETFRARVRGFHTGRLPDSLILLTRRGELLAKSSALLYVLGRLGRGWLAVASFLRAVPPRLLDRGYDRFARVRFRFFGRTSEACPVLPPALRARFDP